MASAAKRLRATSALLDGEGIVYGSRGMPDFNLIHSKQWDDDVSLIALDLLELNGEDLRPQPLDDRKAFLQHLLKPLRHGIEFGEHVEGDGAPTSSRRPARSSTRVSSRSGAAL